MSFLGLSRRPAQKKLSESRAPAYADPKHPWLFDQISSIDKHTGQPNPRKQAAVFIVHGIGTQAFEDTAITFRNGIEDTIDFLLTNTGGTDIPPPYSKEGFWANYEDFASHFSDEWKTFSEQEKIFYEKFWNKSAASAFVTYLWFVKQLFRLCFDGEIHISWRRRIQYFGMMPIGLVVLTGLSVFRPRITARILGDVRVYLRPSDFREASIIQRIDKRVGEQFLQLIGLDWEFNVLLPDRQLYINGKPHCFKYVTWVAHSLGSVVSYNVISDLFKRCEQFRSEGVKLDAVQLVETALHRFITIGSPLEKIALLYREALREWPRGYVARFLDSGKRNWWSNFFHIWDPVSGVLRSSNFFSPIDSTESYVENYHSKMMRIPLAAHLSYWYDRNILSYIISRTYGRGVVDVRPSFKEQEEIKASRFISSIISLLIFFVLSGAVIYPLVVLVRKYFF